MSLKAALTYKGFVILVKPMAVIIEAAAMHEIFFMGRKTLQRNRKVKVGTLGREILAKIGLLSPLYLICVLCEFA